MPAVVPPAPALLAVTNAPFSIALGVVLLDPTNFSVYFLACQFSPPISGSTRSRLLALISSFKACSASITSRLHFPWVISSQRYQRPNRLPSSLNHLEAICPSTQPSHRLQRLGINGKYAGLCIQAIDTILSPIDLVGQPIYRAF